MFFSNCKSKSEDLPKEDSIFLSLRRKKLYRRGRLQVQKPPVMHADDEDLVNILVRGQLCMVKKSMTTVHAKDNIFQQRLFLVSCC